MSDQNKTKSDWKEQSIVHAENLSKVMQETIFKEMNLARKLLPDESALKPHERVAAHEQFEIFMDYFVGTTVALMCQYGSPSIEFEEIIVLLVKDKFAKFRDMTTEKSDAEPS